MKYLKAGDPTPTPEALADIKSQAIAQLDKYSSDPALAKAWHLGPANYQLSSTNCQVSLHRLVLVFHGGGMLLAEEV